MCLVTSRPQVKGTPRSETVCANVLMSEPLINSVPSFYLVEGVYVGGARLGTLVIPCIRNQGFHETKELITTEYEDWNSDTGKRVLKVTILGAVRKWYLECHEHGVAYSSSVVPNIKNLAATGEPQSFILKGSLHPIDTTVKILSVQIRFPRGVSADPSSRDRKFAVFLQEAD